MARELKTQKLTEEAFRPFGRLITLRPAQKPQLDDERLTYWEKVLEFEPDLPRTLGALTVKKRPLELAKLERHVKALEFFIPVDGRCVACFAPAVNPDDPAENPILIR